MKRKIKNTEKDKAIKEKPIKVKASVIKNNIRKKAFIEALKKSMGNITTAEKISNIPRDEHYKWLNTDENYVKEYNRVKDATDDFVESKLFQLINECNPQMIKFYMEKKMKHRGYGEGFEMQITTKNKIDLTALNTDELKLYIELQKKIENSKIEEADYEEENEGEE